MWKKIKNQKGFTVLETILTSMILGVGLLGGMVVMQNASANTVNNDLTTVATHLANEKIDAILADEEFKGYASLTDENCSSETLNEIYSMKRSVKIVEGVFDGDAGTFIAETGTGLKKVDVTVTWGNKEYQKVTVSTLVADYK